MSVCSIVEVTLCIMQCVKELRRLQNNKYPFNHGCRCIACES